MVDKDNESVPDYFDVIDYEQCEKETIDNIKKVIGNLIDLEKTNAQHISNMECEFLFGDLHIIIKKAPQQSTPADMYHKVVKSLCNCKNSMTLHAYGIY